MISLLLTAALVFAQTPTASPSAPPSPFPACTDQIKSLCGDAKDPRGVVQCLRKNGAALTADCQTDLQRYAQASRQAAARGGGALGDFGGMTGLTPPMPIFGYQGRYSTDVTENRVNISSPVAGSESGMTTASIAGGITHFKDAPVLTSGQILPNDLYRAEIGSQTSWRLDGGKALGFRFSVGSSGDQVFQAARDATFSLGLTYSFPGSDPTDRWIALVFFANNSVLGDYIPIPGIVYIHRGEHTTIVVGFPVLSLQYTPTLMSSFSLSIFATSLITEAAYGLPTGTQGFLQGSYSQSRFILHDRAQDRDRLTFEEKKVGVGVRAPLFSASFGELQVGHTFNRKMYVGQKILRAESGLVDLNDEAFVSAQYKFVF